MAKRGNSLGGAGRRRYRRRRSQPGRVTNASRRHAARRYDRPPDDALRDIERGLLRLPEWAKPSETQSRAGGRQDPPPPIQRDGGRADHSPVFVLIHSPLLGPTSWSLVAQELNRRGYEAIVPSLLGIASAPEPQWRYALGAVRGATAAINSPIVLIGHAAGGPLLPAIADVVGPEVAGIIFVDSDLPPPDGAASLAPARLIKQLRALSQDALLPRSSWFRQQVAEGLIPPESPAVGFIEEIPALPLSCFTDHIPMPQAWSRGPCAYLLLSPDTHSENATQARARGWPVTALGGAHHLSIITNPLAVTDTILDLTHALRSTSQRATGGWRAER